MQQATAGRGGIRSELALDGCEGLAVALAPGDAREEAADETRGGLVVHRPQAHDGIGIPGDEERERQPDDALALHQGAASGIARGEHGKIARERIADQLGGGDVTVGLRVAVDLVEHDGGKQRLGGTEVAVGGEVQVAVGRERTAEVALAQSSLARERAFPGFRPRERRGDGIDFPRRRGQRGPDDAARVERAASRVASRARRRRGIGHERNLVVRVPRGPDRQQRPRPRHLLQRGVALLDQPMDRERRRIAHLVPLDDAATAQPQRFQRQCGQRIVRAHDPDARGRERPREGQHEPLRQRSFQRCCISNARCTGLGLAQCEPMRAVGEAPQRRARRLREPHAPCVDVGEHRSRVAEIVREQGSLARQGPCEQPLVDDEVADVHAIARQRPARREVDGRYARELRILGMPLAQRGPKRRGLASELEAPRFGLRALLRRRGTRRFDIEERRANLEFGEKQVPSLAGC